MMAQELFEGLAPLLAPALEAEFRRRDLCILATRIALDVAAYFGVRAEPVSTRAVVYNAAFAAHIERGFEDVDIARWKPLDGSYSVGVGFGLPNGGVPIPGRWNGHLITVAGGWFGDFSIGQAERPRYDILTGPAIVAPFPQADAWRGELSSGAVVEYQVTRDLSYRRGPDWTDKARRRPIVGAMIRRLKAAVPVPVGVARG